MELDGAARLSWTGIGGLPFPGLTEAVEHVLARYPLMPFLPEPASPDAGLLTDALPAGLGRAEHAGFGVKLTSIGAEDVVAQAFTVSDEALAVTPLVTRLRATMTTLEPHAPFRMFKGQIPGPVTLLRYLRDAGSVPLWAYADLHDVLANWCAALAREVALSLLEVADTVTVWLDEPGLGVDDGAAGDEALEAVLAPTFDVLRQLDVETGLHCCGEPPLRLARPLKPDWLHLDIVRYGERLRGALDALTALLDGGTRLSLGCLAVMPLAEDVSPAPFIESLAATWGRPVDALLPRLALAPACGTMLAPPEREHAIAATLATWSRELTSRDNG